MTQKIGFEIEPDQAREKAAKKSHPSPVGFFI